MRSPLNSHVENSEERGKETQESRSQVPVIDVRFFSSF